MPDNSQTPPPYPVPEQGDSAGHGVPPQGYGAPPQGGYYYGGPQQPHYGPVKTNSFAIVSLATSLVGVIFFVSGIVGVIFGHISLKQIQQRGEQGKGMAIAGLVIGYVVGGSWVILLLDIIFPGILGINYYRA